MSLLETGGAAKLLLWKSGETELFVTSSYWEFVKYRNIQVRMI